MKRRLSITNLSLDNNLLMFRLNAPVLEMTGFTTMTTGAFIQNIDRQVIFQAQVCNR